MSISTQVREKRSPFPVRLQAVEPGIRGGESSIPVLLVDSRPLTREWLAKWLEEVLGGVFHVTAVAGPADIGGEDRGGNAELAIVSVGAAAAADPEIADEIGLLRRRLPDVPIVLFAEREEIAQVAAAIRQGVRGYITPNLSPEVALEAIRLVRVGGTFVPTSVVLQAAEYRERVKHEPAPRSADQGLDGFTPREFEVLDRLRRGMSNKMIAYDLEICENTVKVHMMHIMRKLQTTNRTQAALRARALFEDGEC